MTSMSHFAIASQHLEETQDRLSRLVLPLTPGSVQDAKVIMRFVKDFGAALARVENGNETREELVTALMTAYGVLGEALHIITTSR